MSEAEPTADGWSVDGDLFVVVINDEGQHALWPARKGVPEGWSKVRDAGSRADCLAFVETHWTDMRPASLRRAMDGEG